MELAPVRRATQTPKPKKKYVPKPKSASRSTVKASIPRALGISPHHAAMSYWNPAHHMEPPPLRTSFGNFSTLNMLERFTVVLPPTAGVNTCVFVPWTPTPLAALSWQVDPLGVTDIPMTQYLFGPTLGSPPTAVRPLRMSVEVVSMTPEVNSGSAVGVLSYENAIAMSVLWGAVSTTSALLTPASANSLASIVDNAPDGHSFNTAAFEQPHSFVSVPSSFPEYNSYFDFVQLLNQVNGSPLQSRDLWNIGRGPATVATAYPYTVASYATMTGAWGDVPPMRGFLYYFKTPATTQTIEITVRRQDGARYPSNTLGHMFHMPSPPGDARTEDSLIRTVRAVTAAPSLPVLTGSLAAAASLLESVASVGNAARGAVSAIGGSAAAMTALRTLGTVAKLV